MNLRRLRADLFAPLFTAALTMHSAFAQLPHTFANGEVADADKINQNFNYVLEAATNGDSSTARPPEIYLKSNGVPVAIYPVWAYDNAVTTNGYWFRAVPFISAANPNVTLEYLDSVWGKTFLGNDPQCEGQAFGPDTRMPVEGYGQAGLLYGDRSTDSILYGNFAEARVLTVYYYQSIGSINCDGPYEGSRSFLPLYDNNPSVTGWNFGRTLPNPTVGY